MEKGLTIDEPGFNSAMEEQRIAVLEDGADAFVRKPFREPEVLAAIGEFAGVRYVHDDTSDEPSASEVGTLTSDALSALPAQMLADIVSATEKGDARTLESLTDKVTEKNAPLGEALRGMVDDFEYAQILEITEPLLETEAES